MSLADCGQKATHGSHVLHRELLAGCAVGHGLQVVFHMDHGGVLHVGLLTGRQWAKAFKWASTQMTQPENV